MKQPPSPGLSRWQSISASPPKLACWIALSLLALLALVACDQLLPQSAWWLFIGLSLTAGFLHGALDVVLLAREFPQMGQRALMAALYAGAVLLLGLVLGQSLAWALFVLIAMSAWHFGEPYGRWGQYNLLLRAVVGGASIMLPMLVSPNAMHSIIALLAYEDPDLVWLIWFALAMAWLALVPACLVWLAFEKFKGTSALLTEVAAVLTLNILLSPLMAFALYFGVYHSMSHIGRVATVQRSHMAGLLQRPAVLAAFASTATLLGLLWWYLQGVGVSQQPDYSSVLRWLVVALAAVTLPHLILVSRCAHWLQTPT